MLLFFTILGSTQKAAFACGSMAPYVYGVFFFALRGEKRTHED